MIFDYPVVNVNRNFMVYQNLDDGEDGTGSFIKNINLQFMPDLMVVKAVTYYPDTEDLGSNYIIETDLIQNQVIANFVVSLDAEGTGNIPYVSTPNLVFKIINPIGGNYNFRIYTASDRETVAQLKGRLGINLDFIKLSYP